MAKQSVNIGSSENKGDGDPLRTAFQKVNENFDELYDQHGSDTGVVGTESTVDINVNETKIASFTSEGLIPELDETYNLGSPDKKWNSLYVAAETIFLGDKTLSANKILDFDLNISPEILEIQVDEPTAGHGTAWLWTWATSSLPYARTVITNDPQTIVPLYMQGQYLINNFASSIHGDMTQTHSFKLKWVEGAGDDNLVDWVNYATSVKSHPDIDNGNSHTITVLQFTVPAEITIPTLNLPTVNYYVEVMMNDGSLNWMFMPDPANPVVTGTSHGFNPTIGPWYRGGTYIINVNASGHPFYLTTDETAFAAGEYLGEYITGVTGSRTDVGTVTVVVPMDAPDTLYYQCGNHQSMRGEIRVQDLEVEVNENGNYIIYGQHSQEEHFTKIELRPIPALVDQMCLVYDQANNKFVPQDLATYVERTPSLKNKIKEVAGTSGTTTTSTATTTVAGTQVLYDSNYLPVIGNEPGDTAFTTDTGKFYIWANNQWNTPAAETAGATSGNWELLDEVTWTNASPVASFVNIGNINMIHTEYYINFKLKAETDPQTIEGVFSYDTNLDTLRYMNYKYDFRNLFNTSTNTSNMSSSNNYRNMLPLTVNFPTSPSPYNEYLSGFVRVTNPTPRSEGEGAVIRAECTWPYTYNYNGTGYNKQGYFAAWGMLRGSWTRFWLWPRYTGYTSGTMKIFGRKL